MAKFNGGISKPSKFAKTPAVQGREAARQNAFDYIQQLTGK